MSQLIEITDSVRLPADREVVWDLLTAELAGAGAWWNRINTFAADRDPGTLGSRIRWTIAPNGINKPGPRFRFTSVTVEAVRPSRLELSFRGDFEGKSVFRLEDVEEDTRLSLEFSAECRGWAGVFSRLVDMSASHSRSTRDAFRRLRELFLQVPDQGTTSPEFRLCGTTSAARTAMDLRTAYGDVLRMWHWQPVDEPPARATAVLTHGWGSSSRAFDSTVEKLLLQGMDVVTLDWPGHGASVLHPTGQLSLERLAAGLCEVLDLIEVRPVILVGHSGAALVGTLAAAQASTIDGFVFLSAALQDPGATAAMLRVQGGRLLDIVLSNPVLSEIVLSRVLGPSLPTATRALTAARLRAVAPAVRRSYFEASRNVDLTDFGRRVSVPTLVMTGSEDMMFPIHSARTTALTFPHGRFRLLTGRGHALPEEAPDEIARAVLELAPGVGDGTFGSFLHQ
jgi:alpha/beta hydrolase family protein